MNWSDLYGWRIANKLPDEWWCSFKGEMLGPFVLGKIIRLYDKSDALEISVIHAVHVGNDDCWIDIRIKFEAAIQVAAAKASQAAAEKASEELRKKCKATMEIRRRIAEVSDEIRKLERQINECLAHSEEYPCGQCKSWVKPFFDYEQVSAGGVAMTNDYGMTLFVRNNSTQERVRCRQCGKYLGDSGAMLAQQDSRNLCGVEDRLANLKRQERRSDELDRLARSRPYLAAFLRLWV